jgi:hypothetical protein
MTLDDIRKEERTKAYAEVIEGVEQLKQVYQSGLPSLSGHPMNEEAKIVVPVLEALIEGLRKQA